MRVRRTNLERTMDIGCLITTGKLSEQKRHCRLACYIDKTLR